MHKFTGLVLLFLPALLASQNQTESDSLLFAPRPAYTVYELNHGQISKLPVRGLNAYLQLLNGVVIQDGNVHVRGGRDDETAFFVNGFSTLNPLDNSNAMCVIPDAIENLEVLPGFFPARYGGVNSGLVFTELKKGTPEYRFLSIIRPTNSQKRARSFLEHIHIVITFLSPQPAGPCI